MIHKRIFGPQYWKFIGDTPDSKDTPEMIAKLSHFDRASIGSQGQYEVDNYGVVLRIKKTAIVYSR